MEFVDIGTRDARWSERVDTTFSMPMQTAVFGWPQACANEEICEMCLNDKREDIQVE
jgi:hypothetical protein